MTCFDCEARGGMRGAWSGRAVVDERGRARARARPRPAGGGGDASATSAVSANCKHARPILQRDRQAVDWEVHQTKCLMFLQMNTIGAR